MIHATMNEVTRRFSGMITMALTIGLLAVPALGDDASAARRIPDHGSKGQFKWECQVMGGDFDTDANGNTECHWGSGGTTECDANGNDCWYEEARIHPVSPTEAVAPTSQGAVTPNGSIAQSVPDQGDGKQDRGKKHGKRNGKGKHGKRR